MHEPLANYWLMQAAFLAADFSVALKHADVLLRAQPDIHPIVLPVLALFGVVLESPFGAVPYFWAVGVLLGHVASRRDERAATPGEHLKLPTRLRPEVG